MHTLGAQQPRAPRTANTSSANALSTRKRRKTNASGCISVKTTLNSVGENPHTSTTNASPMSVA
jgi:hypothetical protein